MHVVACNVSWTLILVLIWFSIRRYPLVLVYPPVYLTEGRRRQEMRFLGVTAPTCPCSRDVALPVIQKSAFAPSHIYRVNTHSRPNSPVLYHFAQSSLPLFNWKTFCLLLPNHMMWDKCSNPYLWAFKDCNTAFTRQLFDSEMDKLQSYSWPLSWLQSARDLKLVLLTKR